MTNTRKWILTTGLLTLALAATVAWAQAATPAKGKPTTETPKASATPGQCDGQGPHGPMGMGMGHGGAMGGPGMACGKGAVRGAGCGGRCGAGRGAMGRGPGMGPGGPMGHGPGGPLAMLAGLDLTDAQKEKVAAIHERVQRQGIQARAYLELAQLDLGKLMHADSPDPRAIDAQIDKLSALRAGQQKAHAAAMIEVHGLLTPEQLKKARTLHGPGGHPGMGPGGHGRGMGMGWAPPDDGPGDDGIEG